MVLGGSSVHEEAISEEEWQASDQIYYAVRILSFFTSETFLTRRLNFRKTLS